LFRVVAAACLVELPQPAAGKTSAAASARKTGGENGHIQDTDAGTRSARISARCARHQINSYACRTTQTLVTSASATIAGTESATGMSAAHAIAAAKRPPRIVCETR